MAGRRAFVRERWAFGPDWRLESNDCSWPTAGSPRLTLNGVRNGEGSS